MKSGNERRIYERHKNEGPIKYADYNREKFYGARMYNNSQGGMCFVANASLMPGAAIFIKTEDYLPDFFNSHDPAHRAEVKWCKEVADVYASYYGKYEIGVQYDDTTD